MVESFTEEYALDAAMPILSKHALKYVSVYAGQCISASGIARIESRGGTESYFSLFLMEVPGIDFESFMGALEVTACTNLVLRDYGLLKVSASLQRRAIDIAAARGISLRSRDD